MSKSINCPFCNHNETYKVAYRYRGHNRKNGDINYGELIKDGTIYRDEWSHKEKIDFDGEKLKGYLYNKYCPNCGGIMYQDGYWSCTNCDEEIYTDEDDNDGIIEHQNQMNKLQFDDQNQIIKLINDFILKRL